MRSIDDSGKKRTVNDFRGGGLAGESGEGWEQKLGVRAGTEEGRECG